MGDSICLLNLDTGDFIDLGKVFQHPNSVPEVGYEGQHYLLNCLPSIPYSAGGDNESDPFWAEMRRKRGHVLNAFLAASVGCRLIIAPKCQVMDRIDVPMEGFGYLDNTEINKDIVGDNGEFISEATDFYRERLKQRSIGGETYQYKDEADIERLRRKKLYYEGEIDRALAMNIVRKPTGSDQKPGEINEELVYAMGRKPAEPTL